MRRASAILIGVAVVAFLLVPSASAVTVAYGHNLGGSGEEEGRSIGVDRSGNVYLLGFTSAYAANAFLAKRNPHGDLLWQRILDFGGTLAPLALTVDPNGSAYFTGQFQRSGNSSTGTIIGKVLPDGTLGYAKFTSALFAPNAIALDPIAGGAVVTGYGNPSLPSAGILAVDASGGLRWSAFVNGTTIPYGAVVDANGRTFVAVDRYPNNQPDIAIAAFDASGAFVRQLRLDLPYAEYSWSLALGATGDVYYLGFSYSFYDAIFARFTPDVVPKWTEYVGSPSIVDESWKVVSRADGTFFTQGYYYNFSSGESGGETYHLDSAGAIVDTARLPNTGPGGSYLGVQDIALAPDGSLLLAGTSYRSPPRNETPIDGARTLPINASWVSDPVRWYANPTSLVNVTGTLTDPKFQVDDFRGAAEHQAWYGAVDLPPSPVSAIAKASVGGPNNRTVSFSVNISGGTPPYTYRWSFGDGNASMQPSPTHTYAAPGRYPVQLTVEDNATNRAYAFVGLVLGGPPEIDSMSISPNPTYVGQYTSFYATGTDADGSIVNWHWNFGDGSAWDSSSASAYHYYYTLGTYNVTVTARDNDGLETSRSMLLQVIDQPPNACFYVYPNPTVVGYSTAFQDCSWDPDGYIANVTWRFGDGTGDSGRYVYHTFAIAGNYTVRETVTDNAGQVSWLNQSVSVHVNQLPVARFRYSPTDPIAGQYVYFSGANSSDPDGYITSWYWDFGDKSNITNWYYPDTYHYYAKGGRYNVTLTVTDNFNGKNTTTASLYVDIPPTASFAPARAFGKVGTPLVFNASASFDPDGRITRYMWNFGDGGNSTDAGSVVSHVYASTGTYAVTLVVWDDHNATSYFQKTISVVPPKAPFSVLSFTPSRPSAGDPVAFDASLSADPDGTIVRYLWQFGDGATGEGVALTHRYAYPGTYAIHLTVVDEDGIAVTTSSELTVVSQPHAAFSVAPQSLHVFENATFTAIGSWDLTGSLVYQWDFGDGTYGAGWQTSKQYASAGTYHVTLNVTNPFGVSSIAVQNITVSPPVLGHVRAADGSAISGARVTISLGGVAVLRTTTGTDGSFAVSGLGPGAYVIVISRDGYDTLTADWTWDGQQTNAGTWTLGTVTSFGVPGGPLTFSLVILVVAVAAAIGTYGWRRRRAPKAPPPGAQ